MNHDSDLARRTGTILAVVAAGVGVGVPIGKSSRPLAPVQARSGGSPPSFTMLRLCVFLRPQCTLRPTGGGSMDRTRFWEAAALLVTVLGNRAAAAERATPAGMTLAEARARALAHSPGLAAAAAELEAARAELRQAGVWPNPELEGEVEGLDGWLPRSANSETRVTLQRPLPLATRGACVEAARLWRDEAAVRLELARREVVAEVERRFWVALAAAEALRLAEANLRAATEVAATVQALVEAGERSPLELSRAEAERALVASSVSAARRDLVTAQGALFGLTESDLASASSSPPQVGGGQLAVRAPFTGTVQERRLWLGALVSPGERTVLLADTSRMWVQTALYEREVAAVLDVQARQEVKVEVVVPSYQGRVFAGSVERVGGTFDEATRTARARVVVDNPGNLLRAGMTARVRLLLPATGETLAAHAAAVLEDEGRHFVFVRHDESFFVRRPVTVGRTWADWVEIVEGLAAGQEVVTRGAFLLKSGVLRSKMGAGRAE